MLEENKSFELLKTLSIVFDNTEDLKQGEIKDSLEDIINVVKDKDARKDG